MPRQLYIAFNLFVIAAVTFIGVDIFYNILRVRLYDFEADSVLTVRSPRRNAGQGQTVRSYQAIVDRNLFGATGQPDKEAGQEQIGDLEPTTLQVRLLGTIAGDEQSTRAIIEDQQKREQNLYRVGDAIQNAVVNRILRGKVVLRVDGRDQILTMDEKKKAAGQESRQQGRPVRRASSTGRTSSRSTVTLNRQEITASLDNISDILTQVRVEPYMKNGKPAGLLVNDIVPDSIFERMGLLDGDIVQAVNNRRIKTPDDVVSFYQGLKSASRLSLLVTRDGRRKVLNYNIKE
jgi:general secretion pathway protein C